MVNDAPLQRSDDATAKAFDMSATTMRRELFIEENRPEKDNPTMTDETRRRQRREELMAKAMQMQEADRMKLFIEARRSLKKPYSPEAGVALFRSLFRDTHRKATIGE